MFSNERKAFCELVAEASEMINGQKPQPAQLILWWNCFQHYDFELVTEALGRAVGSHIGRLVPAKVMQFLPHPLGHPTAEEAWNYAPKHDHECGYVTDQMITALCAAKDSIARGDLIGGRKCFLEVYEKEINQTNERAVFRFSPATGLTYEDALRSKQQCIIQAASLGWVPKEQAQQRLESVSQELGNDSTAAIQDLTREISQRTSLLIEQSSKNTKEGT